MTMIRIVGLMSVALLTMGSGGVKKSGADGTGADSLSNEVDTISPIYEAPSDISTDADVDAATVRSAASNETGTVTQPVASSKTAAAASKVGGTIELAVSDDYIQGRYFTNGGILGLENVQGDVGVYFSDGRDLIGNIGVMSKPTQVFIDGLTFSAGARGYLALLSDPNDDVFGAAPGVEARYALPFEWPIYAVGNIFYAPDILTLGDAEGILDLDARLEAQIVPSAIGFIGYREFRFDSDEGSDTRAASEIQIGGRFTF